MMRQLFNYKFILLLVAGLLTFLFLYEEKKTIESVTSQEVKESKLSEKINQTIKKNKQNVLAHKERETFSSDKPLPDHKEEHLIPPKVEPAPEKKDKSVIGAKVEEKKVARLRQAISDIEPMRGMKEIAPKAKATTPQNAQTTTVTTSNTLPPRELVVSEEGLGNTLLIGEALRLLKPGDKIRLKKGNYKLLISHLNLPNFEIVGEGTGSVVEIRDTMNINQFNITLKNLKLSHTGTGVALAGSNGKKITLEDVSISGNGNDGVRIDGGSLAMRKVKIRNAGKALELKNAQDFVVMETEIVDSDYGVYFDSSPDVTFDNLKIKSSHIMPIFFITGSRGRVTCLKCEIGQDATNEVERLILKK